MEDLIKFCFQNLLKQEDFKPIPIDNHSSLQKSKKIRKSINQSSQLSNYSQKVLDVWSCVYWRAQKELEKDIELVLKNVVRIWKDSQNFIMFSALGVESFVLSNNQVQSTRIFSQFLHYFILMIKQTLFYS